MTPGDVPYLRGIQKALNTMIAQQAAANDATFVDTYAASIGHERVPDPHGPLGRTGGAGRAGGAGPSQPARHDRREGRFPRRHPVTLTRR